MKKTLKGYIIGFLTAAILVTGVSAAGNFTTLYDVMVGGINIVVDGQKLNPTDANGKPVEAGIYNGTTYLPVRAVANALGKAVYWDGPNYTVYLGDMDGKLEYPTVYMKDMISIDDRMDIVKSATDNYGNNYTNVICNDVGSTDFEYLLNMKYGRFKATLFVPSTSSSYSGFVEIIADGKAIYTSPEMGKISRPVNIDVNVTGYNDVKIRFSTNSNWLRMYLANAGFYQ